ncbi:hypothetical protein TBLA_0A09530 [Henningerozyma blattae CBS 6284]|uniref:CUE domain-containing protein n=1 Tax=Henningerozyma blattae (strain ATCC 34711 / CBS 6284 / DSM 70876 / NBRC 10599 / NRRL Y-10934 / UCD 77-7) TaxID=1071380 RepID=I2GX86_HENB6|nr:hypothetical protein TBLA_0A09530 [Tetrapisispora blattae CBS 6284]CCH58738.1 hypothetical protein TBLA_0A09530 [Tetrapisispora blattae CBS 6284]
MVESKQVEETKDVPLNKDLNTKTKDEKNSKKIEDTKDDAKSQDNVESLEDVTLESEKDPQTKSDSDVEPNEESKADDEVKEEPKSDDKIKEEPKTTGDAKTEEPIVKTDGKAKEPIVKIEESTADSNDKVDETKSVKNETNKNTTSKGESSKKTVNISTTVPNDTVDIPLDSENKENNGAGDNEDDDVPPLPVRNSSVSIPKVTSTNKDNLLKKPKSINDDINKRQNREASPRLLANPIYNQLKDAFPNIEDKYVKAIIIASQGSVDPAFNALLYLSDPENSKDIELPTRPAHQARLAKQTSMLRRKLQQEEQDEILARQLDEKYNRRSAMNAPQQQQQQQPSIPQTQAQPYFPEDENRTRTSNTRAPNGSDWSSEQRRRDRERRRRNPMTAEEESQYYSEDFEDSESWQQFVEKDLPEITDRAGKSLQDTATRVSNWFKSWTAEEEEEEGDADDYGYGGSNKRRGGALYEKDSLYTKTYSNTMKNSVRPERHRFNSFGNTINDNQRNNDSILKANGVNLHFNDDDDDDDDNDDDVPPQLPNRMRKSTDEDPKEASKVVAFSNTIKVEDKEVKEGANAKDTKDKDLVTDVGSIKMNTIKPEPINMSNNTDSKNLNDFLINDEDDA